MRFFLPVFFLFPFLVQANPLSLNIEDLQAPTTLDFYSGAILPNGEIYASGDAGLVYALRGGQWEEVYRQSFPSATHAMYATPQGSLWSFVWGFAQYRYDGQNWNQHFDPKGLYLLEALVEGENEFWGVGYGGRLVHYDRGSWESYAEFGKDFLRALDREPSGKLWVAGHWGAFYGEERGGFQAYPMDGNISITGMSVVGDDDLYLAGFWRAFEGRLLHYDHGTLKDITPEGARPLNRVRRGPEETLWVVGISGQVYRFYQGVWQQLLTNRRESLFEIIPLTAHEALVFGSEGAVWRVSTDVQSLDSTPTPLPTLSPTPTHLPEKPRILAAGFWDSDPSSGKPLSLVALAAEAEQIEVHLYGQPTGFHLPKKDQTEGLFWLEGVASVPGAPSGRLLIGLSPHGEEPQPVHWPYLVVE